MCLPFEADLFQTGPGQLARSLTRPLVCRTIRRAASKFTFAFYSVSVQKLYCVEYCVQRHPASTTTALSGA